MKPIYLDHAAATPLDPRVLKAMLPFLTKEFGNPSSAHTPGRTAKIALEKAREIVAKILHCLPEEIIFTSGGTESVNLAIKGIAFHKKKGHIITSHIEHAAVLETCKWLEKQGFAVSYLPVDAFGLVAVKTLARAIRKDTILITIHYANNEIGTIQPIKQIAQIAQKHNIPFHSDACQAGSLVLDVQKLGVDLLTLNGGKINGPRGSGILYKKRKIKIEPLFHGGGQEFGLRSGTENVAAAVGFATALKLLQTEALQYHRHIQRQRDYLIKKLLRIPNTKLNGPLHQRLPNNINISFKDIDAEQLVAYLNQENIFVSSGSACHSHTVEVSHVLRALHMAQEFGEGSIRISLGKATTHKELDIVVTRIQQIVASLRRVARSRF